MSPPADPPSPDDIADERWMRLAARVLLPPRPRLAACLATLTGAPLARCEQAIAFGARDPLRELAHEHAARRPGAYGGIAEAREAWEMLAPPEWLGDAGRAFEPRAGAPRTEAPPSLRAALALAADPQGVQTAEELGREAGHRLAALVQHDAPARVVWRVADARAFRAAFSVAPRRGTSAGEAALLRLLPGGAREPLAHVERAARLVREHCFARVGGCAWDAGAVVGWHLTARAAGAALDPFAPLVGLWEAGYALDRVDRDAVVLVAPLV